MAWLHHLFLHFPIALSAAAALFVVIGWVRRRDESWQAASRLTAYLSAGSGVLAIATGLASAAHFVEGGGDAAQVAFHRNLALAAGALLLLAAALTWRGTRAPQALAARAGSVVTLVVAAAVSLASHFGGEMLHPGLAPWAEGPHHHGPVAGGGMDMHDDGEAPHGPGAPAAGSTPTPPGRDGQAPVTAVQVGSDGGVGPRPDAAATPGTAAPHPHGPHAHGHGGM